MGIPGEIRKSKWKNKVIWVLSKLEKFVADTDFVLFWQFMQRGLDSETKKQLEEEEKKIISEEHWYLDLPELKEKE